MLVFYKAFTYVNLNCEGFFMQVPVPLGTCSRNEQLTKPGVPDFTYISCLKDRACQ